MPDEYNGTSYPENQDSDNQDNNIPDWMKEAGWDNSNGTFDESKPIFDDLEDDEELVPADIPAWLEEAAPEGFNFDEENSGVDKGAAEETTRAFIDDDLTFTKADNQLPASESEPTPPSSADSAKITKVDPGFDIPSWLKNLEMDEDSQETAVAWLENMPESLRATDEEKAAALKHKIGTLEPPVDELDWIDDPSVKTEIPQYAEEPVEEEKISTAALSENLVASELIPESPEDDQIFDQDEIKSMERDIPSWLQELNNEADLSADAAPVDQSETLDLDSSSVADFETQEQKQDSSKNQVTLPDWLSEFEAEEKKPDLFSTKPEPIVEQVDQGGTEIPDWLSDFKTSAASEEEEEPSSLDWLDDLAGKVTQSEAESASSPEQYVIDEPYIPASVPVTAEESQGEDASNDDTLNTQIPDWLSKIGEGEPVEESKESPAQADFEESAAWLDQIGDPISTEAEPGGPLPDNDLADWLDKMEDQPDELPSELDIPESLTDELETESDQKPIELETAKYYIEEKEPTESLPDWLSDLASEEIDQPTTLESAIRKSEHTLSEDELTFLNQAEETQDDNEDWLAKLDIVDDQPISEFGPSAISVDHKVDVVPIEKEKIEESGVSGGMLDRLKDPVEKTSDEEVPQWLEDLKKEEDPQETAILWLKQFVEQGEEVNIQAEIKRYTDELTPGDKVPKWMEDLKHEEDPQTTAMLWLEKLSGARPPKETPKPRQGDTDESGWLAELDKEVAKQNQEPPAEPVKEFQDAGNGWLEDLEIDEKLKSDQGDMPDWATSERGKKDAAPELETPPWMKATSPLEGDFYTDELAGGAEKEVEIPAWLAGYAEGERPEEEIVEPELESTTLVSGESTPQEEYTWVPAADTPKTTNAAIDLNKAAISQLESILGISYQVAKGIVTYREKHGPFQKLDDLLNVPEITDAQTIEILKPAVVIQEVKVKLEPAERPKSTADIPVEDRLTKARSLVKESHLEEALKQYDVLIKKKKSVDLIIEDLIQISTDHPLDIYVIKTLGDAYMRVDKLDQALEAYSKAEDLLR